MERYLHKCLESLIVSEERMRNLEVLVINDGSKDSSSLIAHEYEKKYHGTYRVIDKENGNYGSCINRGLKEATGKYVKVLDADDYFESGSLDQFLDYLNAYDADLFVTDFKQVYEDGSLCRSYQFNYPAKEKLNFIDFFCCEDTLQLLMHAVTYRLQLFKDLKYKQTEGVSYTDQQWIFLPFEKVDSFYYYPVMLYNYLTGREGQTMATDVYLKSIPQLMKVNIDRIKMYESYHLYESKKERFYTEKLRRAMRSMYRIVLIMDDRQIEKLVAFDKEVEKISRRFYIEMNNIGLFGKIPIRFIKKWRNDNYARLNYFIRLTYKLLFKISNK